MEHKEEKKEDIKYLLDCFLTTGHSVRALNNLKLAIDAYHISEHVKKYGIKSMND